MEINPIFCSFIVTENLHLNNYLLEQYGKERINTTGQSDHLNLLDVEIEPLINIINSKINIISSVIGFNPLHKQAVVRAWVNVDSNIAITQPHSHPRSVFSCVYYVKGNCGDLIFSTPITALDYVIDKKYVQERTAFNSAELSIKPSPGILIIFPSWLTHYVKPSKEERISIAFETDFIKETYD
jgi:uncharacterized protein (TIGR02466 family)